jgi:hypothetical protein
MARDGSDPIGAALLTLIGKDIAATLTMAGEELQSRLASMPTGELVAVIGGVLDQLRRAGVRFDLPAGSQDSTDSTSQSERSDSR